MWLAHGALRDELADAELLLAAGPALLGGAVYLASVRLLAPAELRELTGAVRSVTRRSRSR